jgi:hypothetical protein
MALTGILPLLHLASPACSLSSSEKLGVGVGVHVGVGVGVGRVWVSPYA